MIREFIKKTFRFAELQQTGAPIEGEVSPLYAKTETIGSAGTEIYSGYIQEEKLYAMKGKQRAEEFDLMVRSDSQVQMLLAAVKNPILSAPTEIKPVDDSEEEKKIADFVKYVLFDNSDKDFEEFVDEALSVVEHGHAYIEKTYKPVLNDPIYGAFHGIKGLDLISQKTIDRFHVDANGKLLAIRQVAYGDLQRFVDVPAQFLLGFTVKKKGANHEGISWLRPLYGNYKRKNRYLQLNVAGIEKFAIPTPDIEVDEGFENTPSFAFLKRQLEQYTSGLKNYFIRPKSVKVTWNNVAYDPAKVDLAVDGEDRRMAKGFLCNFLELGMGGGGGSFALGTDLSDFLLSGLVHLGKAVARPINNDLIPEIVRMKFGERAKYPCLEFVGINDKAGKELAEIISIFVSSKVIVPDDQLEVSMRKRYGLPEKSEEGQREATPPAPFGAPGEEKNPEEDKEEEKSEEKKETLALSERVMRRLYG